MTCSFKLRNGKKDERGTYKTVAGLEAAQYWKPV